MKIRKSRLEQIVREEVLSYIGSLLREKSGDDPGIEDAAGEKEQEPADDHQPDNVAGKPVGKKDQQPAKAGEVPGDDEEKPTPPEPADTDLEKQATGEKGAEEEDGEDETGPEDTEKVSDQLVGQTVQSITANPKSKLMPGATEIVFQFQQKPDPLKILVTKSGKLVYYYRGLHNEI
jgi:hypothetical protein